MVVTACGGRGPVAPSTDVIRQPAIIATVTRWEFWNGSAGRYFLDTGDVIELNVSGATNLPATPLVSADALSVPADPGSGTTIPEAERPLVITGTDTDGGRWY